ncbi:MAG: carboxypeptidase-like regulatory domain-containing protein, partial [Muribaculaceae bacterium]|nr:carboxypeptidase-like regulatory domain-containing protein [Muribaculaceae bacterium]
MDKRYQNCLQISINTMRQKLLILCITLGLLSATAADPATLSGIVHDALTSEPIAGVIVKAKGTFTSTDKDGKFNLSPEAVADSFSFSFMGYEPVTLPIDADMSIVALYPKVTRLNDVIVEAPDIYARGDTLVFNVERYATAKDNAIIDVIKRLPGIKVEDDGTIKYQGKPINKFYLDGNDFISNQYGLATNNISHKDVKSVEVMENHQPVKALEGIEFPEEAGINLKLKDDAHSRWVGVAQAAAGVEPFLYDGSLFTMRMASKVQNLFILKADNTGWNPENEIREHNFDNMFSSDYISSLWHEYISADIINAPLSEKRTRDNLSWLANAITAWKTGDISMRLKLN